MDLGGRGGSGGESQRTELMGALGLTGCYPACCGFPSSLVRNLGDMMKPTDPPFPTCHHEAFNLDGGLHCLRAPKTSNFCWKSV